MMILILAPLLLAAVEPSSANAPGERVLFEERFARDLDKGWSWVREAPEAWRIESNTLSLRSLPGYLHANSNNSRNLLIRTPPKAQSNALAIEVSLDSELRTQYEHAGLVWYYDDDNYVALFKEQIDGAPKFQMVTETKGKPQFAVKPCKSRTVQLRLVVTRTKVISQYRESAEAAWQTVGESLLPEREGAKAGLTSGGTPADAEHFARFREFRILELPDAGTGRE
jgi:regulation of enolase protein 1 (concanavalin A-like superfamily)